MYYNSSVIGTSMMRAFISIIVLFWPLSLCASEAQEKLTPIHHIIVFYLENHSFDNLFGTFPGADGIANAGDKATQTDANNIPYKTLPPVMNGKTADARFPANLPNQPFLITRYVSANDKTADLLHRFYQNQAQIDGGNMDKFAVTNESGGLTMGYYEEKDSPLWQYAKRYALADRFFVAAFGGSILNHFWLICACTPRYEHAPQDMLSVLDKNGRLLKDGPLSPDGYVINTIQPASPPFDSRTKDLVHRLPEQTLPTIGDRLSAKNITWAWYGGGWSDAVNGKTDPSHFFPFHHHPFGYFANYAQGTKGRAEHLKDETDFVAAIQNGALPAVSFFKPAGTVDMHPYYTKLGESQEHVFGLVKAIENSPLWKDSVIIITFDDAGGFWDHVAPPQSDRFGPGERIPTLIISPFAKRGFIDHTMYETTSILKLIETKYHLKPLGARDAKANDLTNALQ